MKNWFLLSMALITGSLSFAQSDTPPYKLNKKLPDFEIETVGKGTFKTAQLKKNTPVIIMFFSPGCDHCIHQFEAMTKRINDFKNYQIVMPTYQPIEDLAAFDKKYHLENYPNITTGRDVNYFFPPFFEISSFPHLAFYNSSGLYVSSHSGNMTVDEMLKNFK